MRPFFRGLRRLVQASRLDRRELLAAGLAIAGVGACDRPLIGPADAGPRPDAGFPDAGVAPDAGPFTGEPVAVIGAGLAGLTAAHRLASGGLRPVVFEASERLGGRVQTVKAPFSDGQHAEMGGEIVDPEHVNVRNLCRDLGLVLDDVFDDGMGLRKDTFWFEGRLWTYAQILDAFRPVARLMDRDLARAEEDEEAFVRLDRTSIAEWLDAIPEARGVVSSLLGVAYRGQYGLDAGDQSALNLLYLVEGDAPERFYLFGEPDQGFRVAGGNSALVEALASRLPAPPELGHRLVRITELSNGGYRLALAKGASTVERDFAHVVVALPFSVLRSVELACRLTREKRRAIATLGYGTNAKLSGQLERRVWRTVHHAGGAASSDIGIDECWDATRGQPGTPGIFTVLQGGERGVALGDGTPLEAFRGLLEKVDVFFPGTSAELREASVVRAHWSSDPFALGSYACYRPGQWSFNGVEGLRSGNLHFAGEHCSDRWQGYMEGAVETGLRAASEVLADLGRS